VRNLILHLCWFCVNAIGPFPDSFTVAAFPLMPHVSYSYGAFVVDSSSFQGKTWKCAKVLQLKDLTYSSIIHRMTDAWHYYCTRGSGDGYYSRACSGSGTTITTDSIYTPCSNPSPGQYVIGVCVSGDFTVTGSNTLIASCSTIPDGYFVSSLSGPVSPCISGNSTSLGSAGNEGSYIASPCSSPEADEYVVTLCQRGRQERLGVDTVLASCRHPLPGQYVSSPCIGGNHHSLVGSDTVISACSSADRGQYIAFSCVPGTYNVVGSNSLLCSVGTYSSSASKPCTPVHTVGDWACHDGWVTPSFLMNSGVYNGVRFSLVLRKVSGCSILMTISHFHYRETDIATSR
jgi:hypothetical protein